MAPSVTLVSVMTPPERQGRVTGLLHTAVIAGSLCGPIIGGALADNVGFRFVFVACATLSAGAALMTSLAIREPPLTRERQVGALRPLRLMRSVFDDFSTFLSPGPLRTILICVFIVSFGAAMVDPILALYVETLSGVPSERLATTTGLVFGATALATLLLTPIWGRVGDLRGHGTLLISGAAGAAIFYGAQGLVESVTPLYVLRFCSGACVAGIFPAAYAMAARHSTPERRGGALGLTFSTIVLANALGPATGGMVAAVLGLRSLFLFAAVLMAGAAVRTLLKQRARRRMSQGGAFPAEGSVPEG
jgi:DHA1 family multidrug resistance protein-like MFS transporter